MEQGEGGGAGDTNRGSGGDRRAPRPPPNLRTRVRSPPSLETLYSGGSFIIQLARTRWGRRGTRRGGRGAAADRLLPVLQQQPWWWWWWPAWSSSRSARRRSAGRASCSGSSWASGVFPAKRPQHRGTIMVSPGISILWAPRPALPRAHPPPGRPGAVPEGCPAVQPVASQAVLSGEGGGDSGDHVNVHPAHLSEG